MESPNCYNYISMTHSVHYQCTIFICFWVDNYCCSYPLVKLYLVMLSICPLHVSHDHVLTSFGSAYAMFVLKIFSLLHFTFNLEISKDETKNIATQSDI